MNEANLDWDDLRLFLAVARARGLAPAAAATGKSPPTLGRRMLTLERQVGADLFRRLARGYELTEAGEALLAKASGLEKQILPIVAGPSVPVVKVSAGLWVTHLLCQNALQIQGDGAARLRFIAADEVLDIGRREAVIGVRNQRPQGVGLAGRRTRRVDFAPYAVGATVMAWAQVIGPTPSAKWVRDHAGDAPRIEVTNARNALDLALSGAARVVLPTFIGRQFDALQQVSAPIETLSHDQWLVTHHEDRFVPEVRGVIDRIYAVLRHSAP